MKHRGSPHLPLGKTGTDIRVGHFSQGCGPASGADPASGAQPPPYAQSYSGGSSSQLSGVETETPEKKALVQTLSQSEVARVCPRKVSTTGWARPCLHHGWLVWTPMLLLPARPQTSSFLSCAGTAGAGRHLLPGLPQSRGKWFPGPPPRASGETAAHRKDARKPVLATKCTSLGSRTDMVT